MRLNNVWGYVEGSKYYPGKVPLLACLVLCFLGLQGQKLHQVKDCDTDYRAMLSACCVDGVNKFLDYWCKQENLPLKNRYRNTSVSLDGKGNDDFAVSGEMNHQS